MPKIDYFEKDGRGNTNTTNKEEENKVDTENTENTENNEDSVDNEDTENTVNVENTENNEDTVNVENEESSENNVDSEDNEDTVDNEDNEDKVDSDNEFKVQIEGLVTENEKLKSELMDFKKNVIIEKYDIDAEFFESVAGETIEEKEENVKKIKESFQKQNFGFSKFNESKKEIGEIKLFRA